MAFRLLLKHPRARLVTFAAMEMPSAVFFFCVVELIISTGEKVAILSNTHLGRFNYFIVGLHNLARLIKFMGR